METLAKPELLQDRHHRAPVGESRLEQIESNEPGEQEPPLIYVVAERKADQHKGAGNHSEELVNCHKVLSRCLSRLRSP
jgi:hypothetical protein